MFTATNTERVERQKQAPIFVILGNPPYNAQQEFESDQNRNRKHPEVDRWVSETYGHDSAAVNKNALRDPYVTAIRWASKRLSDRGILTFVTNNAFIDGIATDGMRKHLAKDFDEIYVLDLGGNVRKNPKISGTTHNVFGIQVGVSINIFIRKSKERRSKCVIHYHRVDDFWRKEQKLHFLADSGAVMNISWQLVQPSHDENWIQDEHDAEFSSFVGLGNRSDAERVFDLYTRGVATARDPWAFNFSDEELQRQIKKTIHSTTPKFCVGEWQASPKILRDS